MLVKLLDLPSNLLNALTLHGSHWVGRGHLSSESFSENQAFFAWKEGNNRINFALTPTHKAGACRFQVENYTQPVPDHQPCTSSFSNVKTWGSLVPWFRSARQGTRCPFIKRETCGHTLNSLTCWWSVPTARHAYIRSPPDLRPYVGRKKEP